MAAGQVLVRSAHLGILQVCLKHDICWQAESVPTRTLTKTERRLRAQKQRATRLREVRPDIAGIGERLTVEEAMALGGYESVQKLDLALAKKTRKLAL
jgi:hypothetical protein